MEYKQVLSNGYNCVYCMYQDISGHWEVNINCKLSPYVSLWMMGDEKVRNCKNFITKKQYIRMQKLNKIMDNV